MNLLIISHTPHYAHSGQMVGWGPTIREIDHLASLFDEVVHLAPHHHGSPPGSALPYTQENIRLVPVKPAGGNRFLDKLGTLARMPEWLSVMKDEISRADVLHVRCPAGISLVGLIALRLWGNHKPSWVKYAGNWQPTKDPLTYRIQRYCLKKNLHGGVVTVNGRWPGQPGHIFSFINPSFSSAAYQKASIIGKIKSLGEDIQILFVGRVEREKGVGRVISIARALKASGLKFLLTIIGDGPERENFESLVGEFGLVDHVKFTGWLAKDLVNSYYKDAHFILHPSTASEGWPKVLSEAMAHGVVPIASAIASIPEILEGASAGLALPPGDTDAYVDAIMKYTQEPAAWKRASLNGIEAAGDFTYQAYLAAVKNMFQAHFNLDLNHE